MSKTEILKNNEQIVDSDDNYELDDKKISLEKPKKPKTDAQIKAFEKARLKRAENILKRQEEKQKEKEDFDKIKEMKKQIKEIKIKKAQQKELKEITNDSEADTEPETDSEEEIVVKKKVRTSKVKPKKKVIYVDEDEEPNDRNVIIVNKIQPPVVQQHPSKNVNIRPKPKAIFL